MAIYKKGTTQAQKTKSIIIIIVLVVLLSIPIYKIGKKLLSYTGSSKLPVLGCLIDGTNVTYDLRKYITVETYEKSSKKNYPYNILSDTTDDEYNFFQLTDQGDGTLRMIRYNVNRHSRIINVYASPKFVQGQKGTFEKMLSTEFSYNGTCRIN